MRAEDGTRQGADGCHLFEVHSVDGDLWAGPLIEIDDSIDESCCPDFDPRGSPRSSSIDHDAAHTGCTTRLSTTMTAR